MAKYKQQQPTQPFHWLRKCLHAVKHSQKRQTDLISYRFSICQPQLLSTALLAGKYGTKVCLAHYTVTSSSSGHAYVALISVDTHRGSHLVPQKRSCLLTSATSAWATWPSFWLFAFFYATSFAKTLPNGRNIGTKGVSFHFRAPFWYDQDVRTFPSAGLLPS